MRALSSLLHAFRAPLAVAAAASLSVGCGPEFEPASELRGLRVLGVQKDKPYAQSDETVELSLLYHDARPKEPDAEQPEISIAWLTGCWNPAGDLYAGCFAQFAGGDFGGAAPSLEFGDRISFQTKPGPIQVRPAPNPDYDLSYVFFAVCAGTISLDQGSTEGLPIRCRDDDGKDLGSRDFVVGYSAVYVFADGPDGDYVNRNPAVEGFSFQGEPLAENARCLGEECLATCSESGSCVQAPPAPIDDCSAADMPCVPLAPRVPRCEDDGDPIECPGYDIRPVYSLEEPAEPDAVSNDTYGRSFGEQMWINYYTTRGSVKSEARLLNDATKKYNSDFGTEFYAPSTPGPVQVWAVVHDNRGGVSWSGTTLYVE